MTWIFGPRSLRNLRGVDPRLVGITFRVLQLSSRDISIPDGGGLRTIAQAADNARRGVGIANSRHLTGHALDIHVLDSEGLVPWHDAEAWRELAATVRRAAAELLIPIRQGCDWDMDGTHGATEHDWPHVEIPDDYLLPRAREAMLRTRKELGIE